MATSYKTHNHNKGNNQMQRKTFYILHSLNMTWFIIACILILTFLSGCITTESCSRFKIAGINMEIGCDDIVLQPITRSEELERTQNQNGREFSDK
ncbi:hypothetical protein [Eel River basin pequenovirus]|nr:hypothetical protein [Eel River basin pequenovirus]